MAEKIDTDDLVVCPICFEQFTNPKCLPCHHTFCLHCLNSYVITQLGGGGKKAKEFPCPVCRQEVTVADQNLTSEKIADTMPGNHLISSLIDRSGLSDKGQNKKLCVPCKFDGEHSVAVSWCKHCLEPLCENCVKYHKRFYRNAKHDIIPIEEMSEEKPVDLLEVDEPCMKHTGKVLEVYCVDHKEMCCVICLATSHRKCERISTFEEMVTQTKGNESVEQFADRLIRIEKKADDLRTQTDGNLTTLNSRYDEISGDVTTTVQQAKDKLDHLHSSFMTKLQHVHKQQGVNLTEIKERIELFLQNVKKGQKLLQTVREHGSPKQVFITKEKLKVQLKHHIEGLKVELKGTRCIEYVLNMDDKVTSILNTLTSVANVDVKPTLDLSTCLNEMSDEVDCLNKEQPMNINTLEVSKEHTINPGTYITGGTYLSDGRVLLVCQWDEELRLYDKSGKNLIAIHCIGSAPADVCMKSEFEIAVSFKSESYLKIYEIQETQIKEKRKMSCKSGPWGLAARKDKIIVGYTSQVDVLSMDGRVIQNFSRVGDYVSCVAVSLAGYVYYTDGRKDVVCKSLDGREIRRYTNTKLNDLSGIAVDRHENLYVCGFESHNVCVFSSDGQTSKILIPYVSEPYSIVIDSTGTSMFVGTYSEGCHFYSLEKNE